MIALPAGDLTEMVGKYVTQQTGMELTPGMYQAFMVVNDNKDFVAGVVLTNYRGHDIEISCATETSAAWRPSVCRAVFTYVFEQLGCVRCTSSTSTGNKRARTFLEGLGFHLEGNIRLGYDGRRNALVYGLLRSECRFLAENELENGKEQPKGPGGTGPGSDGGRPSEGEHDGGDDAGEPQPDQPSHAAG